MGRLAAQNLVEVSAASLRPVTLVRLAFPSGSFYLSDWALEGQTYGGQTYTCDGTLLGLSPMSERADGKIGNVELALAYKNPNLLRAARDDKFHYSVAEIAMGFLGPSLSFVTTPDTLGNWYMSHIEIDSGAGMIRLVCEPSVIDLRRSSLVTSSDADQQKRYSGDTFFKHTAAMDEKELEWGGGHIVIRTAGGGGGGVSTGLYGQVPGDLIASVTIGGTDPR